MPKSLAFPGLASATMACLTAISVTLLCLHPLDNSHAADKVGVAAAVTPQASSKPPGQDTRTLKIGNSVVYNERIDTSSSGVVQVLLIDGSTFTVGPGSSLVIDKFVYNPGTGQGSLVASFSKGALRFVGGKLSKQERGITVRTPAGAITVRGGIFQAWIGGANKALITFTFGKYLTLARGASVFTLNRTGMLFAINGPGRPEIRATTAADTNFIVAKVSGKKAKYVGKAIVAKGQRWPYYYGIQPTGRYPDQPFIRELYYNGAAGDIAKAGLRAVPVPVVTPPPVVIPTPTPVVQPELPPAPPPPPPPAPPPTPTPVPTVPPIDVGPNLR